MLGAARAVGKCRHVPRTNRLSSRLRQRAGATASRWSCQRTMLASQCMISNIVYRRYWHTFISNATAGNIHACARALLCLRTSPVPTFFLFTNHSKHKQHGVRFNVVTGAAAVSDHRNSLQYLERSCAIQ